MAREFWIDPRVERHFLVTDLLCGLVFCDDCRREPVYSSEATERSDKRRYDQAVAMHAEGWVVMPNDIRVLCPTCAARMSPHAAE